MTDHGSAALMARHLRLHRSLLALCRHTLAAPCRQRETTDTSKDLLAWVIARQPLLDRIQADDAPRLAEQTTTFVRAHPDHAAVGPLQRLCQGELDLMQALSSHEQIIAAAIGHDLEQMRARLATAAHVRTARRGYAALGR